MKRTSSSNRGFTLIELIVVLAIIVVITTVVITSQSSFNRTLVLANTAYDVALSLRSAETYGLGSRAAGGVANAGYGLHFDYATPKAFILFADTYPAPSTSSVCHPTADVGAPSAQPGNCAYDEAQSEKVTEYALGNGITMSNLCAYALGNWYCASDGELTKLDVAFARPNPDPFVSMDGSYESSITKVCIAFTSPAGGARFVSVSASGQITAQALSCP